MTKKYLLGAMSPRELPFFVDSINQLDYIDIVLAKNFGIVEAEKQIIKFFLEHDYDYLIFCSDDLEIPYVAPLRLMRTIDRVGWLEILTGWSRCEPSKPEANISKNPIPNIEEKLNKPVWRHEYDLLTVREVLELIHQTTSYPNNVVYPVWYVGFSLTTMSRNVVEAWKPRGWYFQEDQVLNPVQDPMGSGREGFYTSTDLWFSYQMHKLGFAKFADLTLYIPHYPQQKGVLNVGKKPEALRFIKADNPI